MDYRALRLFLDASGLHPTPTDVRHIMRELDPSRQAPTPLCVGSDLPSLDDWGARHGASLQRCRLTHKAAWATSVRSDWGAAAREPVLQGGLCDARGLRGLHTPGRPAPAISSRRRASSQRLCRHRRRFRRLGSRSAGHPGRGANADRGLRRLGRRSSAASQLPCRRACAAGSSLALACMGSMPSNHLPCAAASLHGSAAPQVAEAMQMH